MSEVKNIIVGSMLGYIPCLLYLTYIHDKINIDYQKYSLILMFIFTFFYAINIMIIALFIHNMNELVIISITALIFIKFIIITLQLQLLNYNNKTEDNISTVASNEA